MTVRSEGELMGLQMGLNFAAFFDPALNSQSSAVARFFAYMASLLFVVLNGHLMVLMAVSGMAGTVTWIVIALAQYRFRKAFLRDGGQLAVGEDVAVYPGVRDAAPRVLAYRMQQRQPVRRQCAPHHLHEGAEVARV